jgi:hypothetical protein
MPRMTGPRRRDVLAAGLAVPVGVVAGPLASAAAKRPGAVPPSSGTVLLGSKATLSGDELTFTVTVVGSPNGALFEFQNLVVGHADVTSFSPGQVAATGQRQVTVTASPCPPVKGTVDLTLSVNYDVEGQVSEKVSPITTVTIVAPQGFGRSRRP